MCKRNNFQIFLLIAIEMAVLSVFSQKKGLGPLGVNQNGMIQSFLHIYESGKPLISNFYFLKK